METDCESEHGEEQENSIESSLPLQQQGQDEEGDDDDVNQMDVHPESTNCNDISKLVFNTYYGTFYLKYFISLAV